MGTISGTSTTTTTTEQQCYESPRPWAKKLWRQRFHEDEDGNLWTNNPKKVDHVCDGGSQHNYNKEPSRSSSLEVEIEPYLITTLEAHFPASVYTKINNTTTIIERNKPIRLRIDSDITGGLIFALLHSHRNHRKELICALHQAQQRCPISLTYNNNGKTVRGIPVFCEARDIHFYGEYVYLNQSKDMDITFLVNSDDVNNNGMINDANLTTLNIFPIQVEEPNAYRIFYMPTSSINKRFEANINVVSWLPSKMEPIIERPSETLPREIPSSIKLKLVKKLIEEIVDKDDQELLLFHGHKPILTDQYHA